MAVMCERKRYVSRGLDVMFCALFSPVYHSLIPHSPLSSTTTSFSHVLYHTPFPCFIWFSYNAFFSPDGNPTNNRMLIFVKVTILL